MSALGDRIVAYIDRYGMTLECDLYLDLGDVSLHMVREAVRGDARLTFVAGDRVALMAEVLRVRRDLEARRKGASGDGGVP